MNWHQRLAADLDSAGQAHLRRRRISLASPQGAEVEIGGQRLINFCSNDYLGFANHPKLAEAAIEAAGRWGVGSGASHLVCGHLDIAEQFEADFARFVGAEAALLFSTGYMANFALLNSFFDREGLILQDRLNHASLIDAGRLSRATMRRYPHTDMVRLEQMLSEAQDRPTMVASDAVFSMDGNIAPLEKISALAHRVDSLAYFDDAHGFGVLGQQGRGSLDDAGLSPAGNNIMLATLGKALGSFGAVVAADQVFIDSLIQSARPYIYTTALPPTVVATNAAALDLLQQEDWRVAHLGQLIEKFRSGAETLGLDLVDSPTAIQPLMVGDNEKALSCSAYLKEAGFLVTAIRPPTVPVGSARLRITLSAAHTSSQVEQLLERLMEMRQRELL